MKPSSRAVLGVVSVSILLAFGALGSVRLLQKGLPFPLEMVAVLAALGFAVLYLLRGSPLSRRRTLLHALAGGGVAAYFGAALGGLPALVLDSQQGYNALFPGWGPLIVSLAAGAALGAVLFGPLSRPALRSQADVESSKTSPPGERR